MTQHKAGSIAGPGKAVEIVEIETPQPAADEVLVKNHAWAVNPIDYLVRDMGLFASSWPMYIGSDIAGEVVAVGADVSSHKKGDRVLVATTFLYTGSRAHAGYQEYTTAPAVAAAKIPDGMDFETAAVLPLGTATAAAGLYQKGYLELDLPSVNPKPTGKKILVWGGSSSVGSCTIQLAVASGYEVIATGSPKNFDYIKSLGASKVFDYNSLSIVGDLTAELHAGGSDAFAGAFDAVTTRDTQLAIATVIAQLGGGKFVTVRDPLSTDELPATVTAKGVFAPVIFADGNSVGPAVFQDYLPKALAARKYRAEPKAHVVGTGLEAVDGAITQHKKGVSAQKFVVVA